MRQGDVVVGGHYQTRIADRWEEVVVVRAEKDGTKTRFVVARPDGRALPKARTAAALQPLGVVPSTPVPEEVIETPPIIESPVSTIEMMPSIEQSPSPTIDWEPLYWEWRGNRTRVGEAKRRPDGRYDVRLSAQIPYYGTTRTDTSGDFLIVDDPFTGQSVSVPFGFEKTPEEIRARIRWERAMAAMNDPSHEVSAKAYEEMLRQRSFQDNPRRRRVPPPPPPVSDVEMAYKTGVQVATAVRQQDHSRAQAEYNRGYTDTTGFVPFRLEPADATRTRVPGLADATRRRRRGSRRGRRSRP